MKKLILLCSTAMLLVTASCVDSLDDYNIEQKRAAVVPGTTLVSNAERNLARTISSANVNTNPFRLYSQYWAQTTYNDESRYDIQTRNIPTSFWNAMYRDVLRDLQEAKILIQADGALVADTKANQLAAIEILEVYTWSTLVDVFGDIPYTDALNFANPQPKYDDDAAIYADLAKRLDAALASIKPGGEGLGDADLLANDAAGLKRFGNSLKLRMALTIADVNEAQAKTMAEQAAPNVLKSNADNIQLNFLVSPPSTNPVWEDLVQDGRKDFVGADTFVDRLNALNDPRRGVFFKTKDGVFKGGIYGQNNSYTNFSAPGELVEDPTQPGILISYPEVEFLLAEAVERGFAVGGTAADHYNKAVTASITGYGGSATEAATYLAQPSVAYVSAGAGFDAAEKERIGTQKWISLYTQPVTSWVEYRRLDYPKLKVVTDPLGDFPNRFTYPIIEQNLNAANYNAASSAIGGDKPGTKVFWDKF